LNVFSIAGIVSLESSAKLKIPLRWLGVKQTPASSADDYFKDGQLDSREPSGGALIGVTFETVKCQLSILADLDQVPVGITHVATPFPAAIV
jgi:hypothetical protein